MDIHILNLPWIYFVAVIKTKQKVKTLLVRLFLNSDFIMKNLHETLSAKETSENVAHSQLD